MYKNITIYLLLFFLIFTTKALAINPGAYLFRFTNPQLATSSAQALPQTSPIPPSFQFKAGFPNITTITDFNFTISNISLDFGILTPETLIQKTNTLSISALQTHGYSILAYQNHPLQLASNITIPNLTASDAYGFGYNLNSADSIQVFADQSQNQPPQTIFSSITAAPLTSAITYQLKIPSTQAAGDYENTIYFLAIPAY